MHKKMNCFLILVFFFPGHSKTLINITLWNKIPWNHDWRHNSHKALSQTATCDISNSPSSSPPNPDRLLPPPISPLTTPSSSPLDVVWERSLALARRKEENILVVCSPSRSQSHSSTVSSFAGITTFKQQLIFDQFKRGDERDFENSRMCSCVFFFCLFAQFWEWEETGENSQLEAWKTVTLHSESCNILTKKWNKWGESKEGGETKKEGERRERVEKQKSKREGLSEGISTDEREGERGTVWNSTVFVFYCCTYHTKSQREPLFFSKHTN